MNSDPPTVSSPAPARIVALDAWRGFVMLLMMAEVMELHRIGAVPGWGEWPLVRWIAHHTEHVAWRGCTLHDLIQPSFSFLAGAALPFSLLRRAASGQGWRKLMAHAVWRALVLVLLGVWLRSLDAARTYWTFEDTLTQIGLGYVPLFLLGRCRVAVQAGALAVVLVGYWLVFALYPLPGPDFPWSDVGVPPGWTHETADWVQSGFAGHWNMNSNAAWAFDRWFLNLPAFHRETPFLYNGGGYSTLSFIPTLGTMLLGLLAGGLLRREATPGRRLRWFVSAGAACLATGLLLDASGVCPSVKRIWTPSWVLVSGGWCFLLLAFFYWLADIRQVRRPLFVLLVIGMNSIAAYLLSWLLPDFLRENLYRHFGEATFVRWPDDDPRNALLTGCCVLLLLWLILWWMHRRRIFLRV